MAVIYLKHPEFGAKVATMDAEAAYDKEHGWEEFDPTTPVAPAPADLDASQVEAETVVENALQPKRRGRPPREAA